MKITTVILRSGAVALITLQLFACSRAELPDASRGAGDGSGPAPIKVLFIGQITDTANATALPEAAAGVHAAIASINKRGGILDWPVELLICDDKADGNEAAKCARKAAREGVVATLGNTSNYGNVILPVLAQAGIASIGHNPISAEDFNSPVAFPLQGGSPVAVAGAVGLLVDLGARRIRLATVDSPAGGLSEGFAQAGLTGTGAELVGATLIPVGAPDYASYAAALVADSDGIVISTNADQAARIVVALRQAGVKQPLALPAVALPPTTLGQLGEAAEGLLVASNFRPAGAGGEANTQFEQEMSEFSPGARRNMFSRQSWLAARTLAVAIAQSPDLAAGGTIDAATVLALMGRLDALPMGAMTPPLTTTTALSPPYSRLFSRQVLYGRVKSGAIELLNDQWHPVVLD
jgi:ABC-type branched-subunit amino acid transport system substrate-binding protein